MNCPACENELSKLVVAGIAVDVCRHGCGGIWFDNFEFKKFDEPHEAAGEELLQLTVRPGIRVDHSEKRPCPRCRGVIMMRHFYSVKKEVEVDECAACAGVGWMPGS